MSKLILILFLLTLFLSCRKSENDLIWEKSYGKGAAYCIKTSSDSGFVACGNNGGNPYVVRFDKNRKMILDFKSENPGLFSSVWFDTSGYIAGGSTSGEMLLMRYSATGRKLWEQSFNGGYKIDFTNLFYTGSGNLLAIGTSSPDSSYSDPAGLLLVRFDTTGQVIMEKKITNAFLISASGALVDKAGNIFMALTRRQKMGDKSRASVAEYNDQFDKLWETELYNNPAFGATSLAIIFDESANIDVAGKTELLTQDGTLNNSFIASLNNTGTIRWKRYLEGSNEGSAVVFNNTGELLMLNKNCFIINILNPEDGVDAGTIRTFSLCDSNNSDAIGSGMDLNFENNILISGKRGGNFYLALKSSQ